MEIQSKVKSKNFPTGSCTYFIICLLLTSCKTYTGTYITKDGFESLVVKPDSTFTYEYKIGWNYQYSQGNWSINGLNNFIKLNSNKKEKWLGSSITEKINPDQKKGELLFDIQCVVDTSNAYQFSINLLIDSVSVHKSNCGELITTNNNDFKWFQIALSTYPNINPVRSMDTLFTKKYYLKNRQTNYLEVNIKIDKDLFNYKILDDRFLYLNRRKRTFVWQ